MNETDEDIYNRFLKYRDEADLLILLTRHREGLTLFINGLVHDIDAAAELMMDTYAEIAAGPALFSGRSSFKTWLYSVGRHLALGYLRKNSRSIPQGTEVISIDAGTPADSLETRLLINERNRQLYTALSKLSEDYRLVLILLYFEDMSPEEAARVMHRSRRQIYHLAERGKNALRKQLESMGLDINNI